jgi:hypothetical protein
MGLYEEVVEKTAPYLGASTQRFLERQCKFHLKVDPHSLGKEHINDLARWVGISASLLIDREKADALKKDILSLV